MTEMITSLPSTLSAYPWYVNILVLVSAFYMIFTVNPDSEYKISYLVPRWSIISKYIDIPFVMICASHVSVYIITMVIYWFLFEIGYPIDHGSVDGASSTIFSIGNSDRNCTYNNSFITKPVVFIVSRESNELNTSDCSIEHVYPWFWYCTFSMFTTIEILMVVGFLGVVSYAKYVDKKRLQEKHEFDELL